MLLVVGRAQGYDVQHLRLTPGEQRGPVDTRQQSHLGTQLANVIEAASVNADPCLDDMLAHRLFHQHLKGLADLVGLQALLGALDQLIAQGLFGLMSLFARPSPAHQFMDAGIRMLSHIIQRLGRQIKLPAKLFLLADRRAHLFL